MRSQSAPGSTLFGSRRRTEVLLVLALLDETYPTELAAHIMAPLYSVQKIVAALEREGVVTTTLRNHARWVKLDPRYAAHAELRELLLRLAEGEVYLKAVASTLRDRR